MRIFVNLWHLLHHNDLFPSNNIKIFNVIKHCLHIIFNGYNSTALNGCAIIKKSILFNIQHVLHKVSLNRNIQTYIKRWCNDQFIKIFWPQVGMNLILYFFWEQWFSFHYFSIHNNFTELTTMNNENLLYTMENCHSH